MGFEGKTEGGDKSGPEKGDKSGPEGSFNGTHATPPGPITRGTELDSLSKVEVVRVLARVVNFDKVVGMNVSL